MRLLAALLIVLSAVPAPAQELTVAEVVAAYRAGAPEDGIVRLIREAPQVVKLSADDLARLRATGVPERVIQAMVARTAPIPTPATAPDDSQLAEIVALVGSGLPSAAVVEQVQRSGPRTSPTANDLAYLKRNGVPDAVIIALLEKGVVRTPAAPATAAPAPTLTPATSFGPLLRMAGVFRKSSMGTLAVASDTLTWHDATTPEGNSALAVSAIRFFWVRSEPRGSTGTVSELCIRTTAGDETAFRDPDWETGGEREVLALFKTLKERFPQLILREKPQR